MQNAEWKTKTRNPTPLILHSSFCILHSLLPLTPALSPEYRGEGVGCDADVAATSSRPARRRGGGGVCRAPSHWDAPRREGRVRVVLRQGVRGSPPAAVQRRTGQARRADRVPAC